MIRTGVCGYIPARPSWCGTKGRGLVSELLRMGADRGESRRADRANGGCRVVIRMGEGRRLVSGSALRRRAQISVISTLVAFAVWLVTAASAFAFTAQGSVNQVYVTGVAANAQMSLLNK